jgi:2-C-methyl-D-erythritol 4-phosphate cytidylyltransferase
MIPRIFALIAAGGSGSRAGGAKPKQYQVLAGRPVLAHTLRVFAALPGVNQTLVLTAPQDPHWPAFEQAWADNAGGAHDTLDTHDTDRGGAARASQPRRWTGVPRAGAARAQTVANGLDALLQMQGARLNDWVLVHDAARCLVTVAQMQGLIDACLHHPVGGLLATPVADTLKQAEQAQQGQPPCVRDTLDRSDKWLAQTPQMFRLGVLRDALCMAGDAVTDESSAVEALGLQPLLVRGSAHNIKLTWPEDFALAEAILQSRQ